MTICGLVGGRFDKDTKRYEVNDPNKASYEVAKGIDSIRKGEYVNMLPLLIESYPEDTIIALATKEARDVQEQVLKNSDIDLARVSFEDIEQGGDGEYQKFFKLINEKISDEGCKEVVVDLSHGYRHLPILTIIALVVQHIQTPEKIKHILFAQEKIQGKRYIVIDLLEYLEISNFATMLSTFSQNYTVSNHLSFQNRLYSQIAKELKKFSDNILANSLKTLIDDKTIEQIQNALEQITPNNDVIHFGGYIKSIIEHLEEIKNLRQKEEYMKLYKLSKIMYQRGYLLNAITLLFESIGFYCVEMIRAVSPLAKRHIDKFQNNYIGKKKPETRFSIYALTNQSRNFVKLSKNAKDFNGDYLYNPETIDLSERPKKPPKNDINEIHHQIRQGLNADSLNIQKFRKLIENMEKLRNNLAHGNSSESLEDVKGKYERYLDEFSSYLKSTKEKLD